MPTVSKSKISFLELVYPPISNQEAVWLQNDADVEKRLRESDFYMIGGRAEAKFIDISADQDTHVVRFDFKIGDISSRPVRIHLRELPVADSLKTYELEAGEKMIRVWDCPERQEEAKVVAWFTTEKLLWDASHGTPGIYGLENSRDLATYDLLYVGIATKGDSFDRLIANGHRARMEILGNEPQRLPGARVTDETYLFLFNVNPLVIRTFEPDHVFEGEEFSDGVGVEPKRIVADAEKAFVSLLKPQYNIQKFVNYPQGADGLYGSDFVRYGYAIVENIAFNTAHGRFKGARDAVGFVSNDADCIFVEGDAVKFFVSGVDYPGAASSEA